MMEAHSCPTCGHPLEPADPSAELLRLLHGPERRQVYRINNSTMWAVTSARGAGHFNGSVVRALVAQGLLAPVYPGTTAERECYGDAAYYGSARYKAEIREKIQQRDERRIRQAR